MTVLLTGICSVIVAVVGVTLFIVFPAWKRYRVQCAITTLSTCISRLNCVAFPEAKIRNGKYLHDKFYKLIFAIYTNGPPKIVSTARIQYDEKRDKDIRAFRAEIENLDPETKTIIDESMLAISLILFFNNMVRYPLMLFKCKQEMNRFNRESRVKNTADLVLSNKDDVISFQKQCHA